MTSEKNKALVRHIMEESWNGNITILNEHPGMNETIPFLRHIMETLSDTIFHIEEQLSDGNWVVTRVVIEATHSGEFVGTPPSGERIRLETIMMHQVIDGIIVKQYSQGGRVDSVK